MFTGIIQTVVDVEQSEQKNSSLFLKIKKPINLRIRPGDSISLNGVCLTVVKVTPKSLNVELMSETLAKTSFGKILQKKLNFEAPLNSFSEIGGHSVLGHVDTVGKILQTIDTGNSLLVKIGFPSKFFNLLVEKGSVAVNGVSLTVLAVGKNWLTLALTPYTLINTTFKDLKVGDWVNLEFDMIGKYVNKLFQANLDGYAKKKR